MATTYRKSIKSRIVQILFFLMLALMLLAVFLPLLFVLNTSFKDPVEYMLNPVGINLSALRPQNYADVLNANNLVRSMINSVIVTGFAVLCSVICTALISFAIGVLNFKGNQIIYFIAICSMFLAGEITMIPMYMLYKKLNLIGKIWSLILPSILGLPGLGIMVGSSYIRGVPKEIHEAAFIDGASVPQVFFKIDLVMLVPVLALTAVMTFQGNWGNFLWPYVTVLSNKDAHTFAITLLQFKSQNASMYGQYCAGLVIMTLPIVIVYCFCSKYFMEGMAAGSVKG
ncbi:MAG: carbohydrate ABC transporter permease [Clostridia bacterium]|nr:carbohydrate ABC transporter permease [Clostridia bacterium]